MKIYLVFGECDGFGNDVYLSGVARSLEKAQELIKDAAFWGSGYEDLDLEKQKELLESQKIQSNSLEWVDVGGIYEVEVTE